MIVHFSKVGGQKWRFAGEENGQEGDESCHEKDEDFRQDQNELDTGDNNVQLLTGSFLHFWEKINELLFAKNSIIRGIHYEFASLATLGCSPKKMA